MISAQELQRLFPELEGAQAKAERLSRLAQRMLEEGSRRGVTALKTADSIKNELILDSLAGLPCLPTHGQVIDIGTGGGVPGLVLAVVRPDLSFVLTDSAARKTTWVQECVQALALPNVEVRTVRLELLGRDPLARERFDAVTAKALASLAVLVELAFPLLKVGGKLIAYKGPALPEELEGARKAFRLLHAEFGGSRDYTLGDKSYRIAEILKNAPTPNRYPRRDGVPQKSPL
jgi:16S rRNA (guanine527-N7)-methyltransferase